MGIEAATDPFVLCRTDLARQGDYVRAGTDYWLSTQETNMLPNARSFEGKPVPQVTFKTRRDNQWLDVSTGEVFKGGRWRKEERT